MMWSPLTSSRKSRRHPHRGKAGGTCRESNPRGKTPSAQQAEPYPPTNPNPAKSAQIGIQKCAARPQRPSRPQPRPPGVLGSWGPGAWSWILGLWVLGCPGKKNWGPGVLGPGPGFWGCGSWGAQEKKNWSPGVLGSWGLVLDSGVVGPGVPRRKRKEKNRKKKEERNGPGVEQSAISTL